VSGTLPTFRREFADLWQFLLRPRLTPRLPSVTVSGQRAPRSVMAASHASAWLADWRVSGSWRRLLAWAACLWALNLFLLGPLALLAAGQGGATHRINLDNLPVLTAVLWAPLVEELLFRYGLRRPAQACWLAPVMAIIVLNGPQFWTGALVAAVIASSWHLTRTGAPPGAAGWRWRRHYVRAFGLTFHLVSLAFAVVHWLNYCGMSQMPVWLMPLLILPQWATGLVVGWLRVRRGIGAAIALHALFNGGPVLAIWLLLKLLPAGLQSP